MDRVGISIMDGVFLMDVTVTKTPSPLVRFLPVTIAFTFHSQKELNAMGALFNYASVVDVLNELVDAPMFGQLSIFGNTYESFVAAGADTDTHQFGELLKRNI